MKIDKCYQVEQAASKSGTRPLLEHCYLDTTGTVPMLVATDGHILAAIPVEATSEEQGYVPVKALKTARKKVPKKAKEVEINLNGTVSLPTGESWPRPTHSGTFPQWRAVLPDPGRPGILKISLDIDLLEKLANALGNNHVTLELDPMNANGPIRVTPYAGEGSGAIMPLKAK